MRVANVPPASAARKRVELEDPGRQRLTAVFNRQLLVLLLAIAVFQLVTIRAGHVWGDDHALYLLHARALLEGRNYGDTGWVYNPAVAPFYSPRIYPPGFPLLLLPVYALLGLNLGAMKILVTLFFVAAAGALGLLARRQLPASYTLGVVALFGFQPYLTHFKDNVLPDLPFIFFVLAALLLVIRLEERDRRGWRAIGLGVLLGVLIWYTTALRTIGVVLVGTVLLSALARRKLPGPAHVTAVAVAGALLMVQHSLMPSESGYVSQVALIVNAGGSTALVPETNKLLRQAMETFLLWDGLPHPLRNSLGVLALVLACSGFVLRLRRPTAVEAFALLYGAAIALYPAGNLRYTLPLVPLLFLYAATALWWLHRRARRPALALLTAIMLATGAGYLVQLVRSDFGPITDGSDGPDAVAMYRLVRRCTAPGDLLVFGRPRVLALYTRRSVMLFPRRPDLDVPAFLAAAKIDYAVAAAGDRLDSLAIKPGSGLTAVAATDRFVLYRHQAQPASAAEPARCAGSVGAS